MKTHNGLHLADLYLDPTKRGEAPKEGQIGFARMLVKSIDEDKRRIDFVMSTPEIDRYGEIVDPHAFEESLPGFMLNPVFVAGHVYIGTSGEPTVIGSWVKLAITDHGLFGTAEFDADDPLAQRYWNLYKNKRLRAVSIGFLVHEWTMREVDIAGVTQRVRVFTRAELVECSAVAIPANRASLARAASAFSQTTHTTDDTGDDALEERITRAVQSAFERLLNDELEAGPGGRLCSVLSLAADTLHGHAGLGDAYLGGTPGTPAPGSEDDDIPDDVSGDELSGGANDELKALLRDAVGANGENS